MKKALTVALCMALLMGTPVNGGAEVKKDVQIENISEVSVHDPSIIKDKDGQYYVFGSHITTAKSDDLINWKYTARGYKTHGNVHFGDLSANLSGSFKWAGENDSDCLGGFAVWAPDVYYNEKYLWDDGSRGAYMMYYSASSTYKRSCIGLAVSKNIDGEYKYVDTVLYSGFTKKFARDENSTHNKKYTNTNIYELIEKGRISGYKAEWGIDDYNNIEYPNAIDPCVYEDKNGKLYLAYGSWSGGIFSLPLNELTGMPVYPGFDGKTEDGRMIDRYFGTHIAGGKGWSGEGPFVYYDKEAGYYYLQTSYDWLGTDGGYHIRMFRSENPTGPFTDIMGNNAVYGEMHAEHGVKMFGNYYFESLDRAYTSGGHCSSLIDDEGERYVFYHTRFKNTEHFTLRVHQMFINEDGWPVIAPFRYLGSRIEDEEYTDADIIGMYEYINHGTGIAEGTKINTSQSIMLLNNGVITGSLEGYWRRNGNYVTFNVNSKTYKGVFFKGLDESGENVMTFSLVGGNNEAIWGAKRNLSTYTVKEPIIKLSFENNCNGVKPVTRIKNQNPAPDENIEVQFKDGYSGKAISLDGRFGLELEGVDLSEDLTLSFWVKPEKIATYTPIVAASEDFIGGGADKWFSLTTFSNGNDAVVWSRNAEKDQWLEGKSTVGYKIGNWQHVTLVFDHSIYGKDNEFTDCKMYINGLCVASGAVTSLALTKDSKLYFGINPWDEYFKGVIDEATVFDYAFSHEDALTYYNSYFKMP